MCLRYGNVARMLANSNCASMEFRNKLEKIKLEMSAYHIPEKLQCVVNLLLVFLMSSFTFQS